MTGTTTVAKSSKPAQSRKVQHAGEIEARDGCTGKGSEVKKDQPKQQIQGEDETRKPDVGRSELGKADKSHAKTKDAA